MERGRSDSFLALDLFLMQDLERYQLIIKCDGKRKTFIIDCENCVNKSLSVPHLQPDCQISSVFQICKNQIKIVRFPNCKSKSFPGYKYWKQYLVLIIMPKTFAINI